MPRNLKTTDSVQVEKLVVKQKALQRATKRLGKLKREVAELAGILHKDAKEGFKPGWYEKKDLESKVFEYLLVLNVKCTRDGHSYDVKYIQVLVGKLGPRVVFLNEEGQEAISKGNIQGCSICLGSETMDFKNVARLTPVSTLLLTVKHGVTEGFVRDSAPKIKSDDTLWCYINGKWQHIVGIVDLDLSYQDLFEDY